MVNGAAGFVCACVKAAQIATAAAEAASQRDGRFHGHHTAARFPLRDSANIEKWTRI